MQVSEEAVRFNQKVNICCLCADIHIANAGDMIYDRIKILPHLFIRADEPYVNSVLTGFNVEALRVTSL